MRISSNLLESVEETSGERLIYNYEFGGFLKEFYGFGWLHAEQQAA